MAKSDLEFSPLDRAALNQGHELERRKRVIRKVWVRLMATALASSVKRYIELVDEARKIIAKEAQRLYELDHPSTGKQRRSGKAGSSKVRRRDA